MQNSNKGLWVAVIVVAIIAIGACVAVYLPQNFGATGTRFPNGISANTTSPSAGQVLGTTITGTTVTVGTGGLNVGSTGTNTAGIWSGECYLFIGATAAVNVVTATSTLIRDCQATNPLAVGAPAAVALSVPAWQAGDAVFVSPVASSTIVGAGLNINAVGSSTAGFIQIRITNNTGADFTFGTTTGIKYQYLYIR